MFFYFKIRQLVRVYFQAKNFLELKGKRGGLMEEIFLHKNNKVKSKSLFLSGRKRSETHRLQADLSASRVQISSPA